MDAPTIQKIVELAAPTKFELDGLAYTDKRLTLVKPPVAEAFSVGTLDGFVNMLEAGIDSFDAKDFVIHVVDHEEVRLSKREADVYGDRIAALVAKPTEGITDFPYFNDWGGQEDFIIGLQSHFQDSEDLKKLLDLASHIDLKESVKLADTGVSQEVTAQKGVAFREQVEVKARLSLKPFRTFRELDQPASDFIFRVKNGGGFALFEADGGAWKIAAINAIAAWLGNRLHTSEVAQLDTLPIIS
jgi:hypothetical protein